MAALLQEEYYDTLEYVCNIQQLGGDIKMAEYQARYQQNYVHNTIKEYIAHLKLERFATKEDLQLVRNELKLEINEVRNELKLDIANLRTEVKSEIAELRTEVKSDISQVKVELLRWQIGIAVIIMSANFALLKIMLH